MKETQLIGKLLPTHPDIYPILEEVRIKYKIPPISPNDDSLKTFVKYELGIDWNSVYLFILEKIKDSDLLPEKTTKLYKFLKKSPNVQDDPEFEKVSKEFKDNIITLVDLFLKQFEPIITSIDKYFEDITKHCLIFLLTGEALEVPQDWFSRVEVMSDYVDDKIIFVMASKVSNPEDVMETFKSKYQETFGKYRPTFTEKQIDTADFLRMKWEGKSVSYLLEEEDLRTGKDYQYNKSNRQSPATRRRHAKMRQKLHRLQKNLYELLK